MRQIILSCCLFVASLIYTVFDTTVDNTYDPAQVDIIKLGPPNYQLYDYIEKYHNEHGIPMDIALNIPYKESTFKGKFDFHYKPYLVSSGNALGPMQVLYSTARPYWDDLSQYDLQYDIETNVLSSFMYLKDLKGQYGSWLKVSSVYNQGTVGKDSINQYAKDVAKGKLWQRKFIVMRKQ